MKIIFAVFLCGLLVAAKAEEPVETEYEDPEDELNDLAELDFDDVDEKPASLNVAFEALTRCLIGERGQLKPHSPCLKKFKSMFPKEIPEQKRREIVKCILKGLENCRKLPQHHEFWQCLTEAAKCEEGIEGSGGLI